MTPDELTPNAWRYVRRSAKSLAASAPAIVTATALAPNSFNLLKLKLRLGTDELVQQFIPSLAINKETISSLASNFHGGSQIVDRCNTEMLSRPAPKVEDLRAFKHCVNSELSTGSFLVISSFCIAALGFGLRSIWRSVAFSNLAYRTKKGTLAFKLDKNKDNKEKYSPQDLSSSVVPEFNIVNGVNSYLKIRLPHGAKAYSQRGAFLASHDSVQSLPVLSMNGQGAKKNLMRVSSGESPILVEYQNNSKCDADLLLTPRFAEQITAIPLENEQTIYCRNGAFFASSSAVEVDIHRIRNLSFRVFGGQGATMQSVQSTQGPSLVFITSGGQTIEKELHENENMNLQGESLLACTEGVSLSLKERKGFISRKMLGVSEFMTTVTGPGKIWFTLNKPKQETLLSKLKSYTLD